MNKHRLIEHSELELGNRCGEVSVGWTEDGRFWLILNDDTRHEQGFFANVRGCDVLEIPESTYLELKKLTWWHAKPEDLE